MHFQSITSNYLFGKKKKENKNINEEMRNKSQTFYIEVHRGRLDMIIVSIYFIFSYNSQVFQIK